MNKPFDIQDIFDDFDKKFVGVESSFTDWLSRGNGIIIKSFLKQTLQSYIQHCIEREEKALELWKTQGGQCAIGHTHAGEDAIKVFQADADALGGKKI